MLIPLEVLIEGRKGRRKSRQRGNVGMTAKVLAKRKKEANKQQKPPKPPKSPKPIEKKEKKRHMARGGLTKKQPKITPRPGGLKGPAPQDKVGAQLQHCVLKVKGQQQKTKPGQKKRKKLSTRAAWNICRWSLTRHGYLKDYTINQKLSSLRLTRKGSQANMKHAKEPEAPEKYKDFGKVFRGIEGDVVAGRGREYKSQGR